MSTESIEGIILGFDVILILLLIEIILFLRHAEKIIEKIIKELTEDEKKRKN